MVGHAVADCAPQAVPACLAAARGIGESVDVLLTGHGAAGSAAAAVSKLDGVSRVICADHPALEHELAEPVARLVAEVMKKCAREFVSVSAMHHQLVAPRSCRVPTFECPSDPRHECMMLQKEIQQLHHACHYYGEEHLAKSSCFVGVPTNLRRDCGRI